MKKASIASLMNVYKWGTNSQSNDENGDPVVYCSDEEIENGFGGPEQLLNKMCNKISFKRKGSFFKVLPWKWSRNPKNKRSDGKRCGLQEKNHSEYCPNKSTTPEPNEQNCSCPESKVYDEVSNCEVCIVIESPKSASCSDPSTLPDSPKSQPNMSPKSNVPCNNTSSALMSKISQEHLGQMGRLTQELFKLSKCGWYWGPITRSEADEKLMNQPDGAFLVRDSSDDCYLLSLSFRSCGQTLHTRIEHSNGLFSFYTQKEQKGHSSIIELIDQSINFSQSGVYCYSRNRSQGSQSYPVRLIKPISRFTQVRSLQYLCRFVIRQYTRFDHIQKLPLPVSLKGYLEEAHY